MKLRKIKKAFTLVELVVVIAIIAILSGVSIAVYGNITKEAQQSADSQIVTQLNMKLRADAVLEGKNKTAHDAVIDAAEAGFNLNLLKPSYGDHYVWDEENDLFAVTKGDEIVSQDSNKALTPISYKRWIFTDTPSADEERSQYYTKSETIESLKVKAGFDAGYDGNVKNLTYENKTTDAKDVTIRTNSYNTEITIDAPKDTVRHFDRAKQVDVVSVATHSYHEHGDVLGNINLQNGRVVLENNCDANAVMIDASAEDITAGTVVVSANNDQAPEVPIIVRDTVKEAADNKGGENNIPEVIPNTEKVIVLSDKVIDENGQKTETDAVAQLVKANKNYASMQGALNAMTPGDTLILLKDIENSSILRADKSEGGTYKIDLNNHSITFTTETVDKDEMAFEIEGEGNYIISNGTLSAYDSRYGDVLEIYCDATLNNLTINFEDSAGAEWGALYSGSMHITLNGCDINAIKGPGIQNGEEDARMIINDSTVFSGDNSALYCGGGSITEVNNSEVRGNIAVHACTSGAIFYLNSGHYVGTKNALQLDNTKGSHDYLGVPNYAGGSFVFVNGGSYEGNVTVNAYNDGVAALYVYGGTFTANVDQYRVSN